MEEKEEEDEAENKKKNVSKYSYLHLSSFPLNRVHTYETTKLRPHIKAKKKKKENGKSI